MKQATERGSAARSPSLMRTSFLAMEAAYWRLASQQLGLVTTEQLRALGMSPSAISRRVQAGALIQMFPSVLRLASVPRSWHQRVLAVQLWAGADSLIAGCAAAALHRLDGFPQCPQIDVITPRSLKPSNRLVVVRRPSLVPPEDRAVVNGIPITSCIRTLIDVAGQATEARLELAFEDARRRKLVTPQVLAERIGGLPLNQPGRKRLMTVLETVTGTRPTDSGLEVKVLRLLRSQGYPPPIRQEVLTDDGEFAGRVDLVYPERRLIIEVQSHGWHSDRRTQDADSERVNKHQAMGWVVMEATSTMLHGEARAAFLRDLGRLYDRALA